MRRLIPRQSPRPRTLREGGLNRAVTRSALVFLLASALGMAYLASRTPALASLLNPNTVPPEEVTELSAKGSAGPLPSVEMAPGEAADSAPALVGSSRSAEILAAQGLVLDQITVSGRVLSDTQDLLDAVGVVQGAPLMAIDPVLVRTRLLTLPWVASARVERRLPAELHLDIIEREPMALWQHDGAYAVIDRQGNAVNVDPGAWAHLPMVVGKGAAERAAELLNLLTTQPAIAARVKAAILVGERRWTLRLDDVEGGMALRLPAQDPADALATIAELDSRDGLLSKDLAMIDMRLPGRLVVRLVDRTGKDTGTGDPGEGTSAHRPVPGGTQPHGEGRDA
ncbi:MAG: cell division protein FtsQ/DivIB [Rhodospirillum sp.]|nr:cell division protein FtsQ/DivIB [Rhodospirillum sp.]MCF8488806.1 cell division protein FtsQ/DivIB [Rhodospirillum sp.]MCF8500856.1 cell division protein FtsQ/DivIB [Rhodospirillum sp.]